MAKAGRPRLFDGEVEQRLRQIMALSPHLTSRTFHNALKSGTALKVLCGGPTVSKDAAERWNWLLRPVEGQPHSRMSIMYQLGHTKQPEALKVFADELCSLKPRAELAIRMVRQWQSNLECLLVIYVIQEKPVTPETLVELAHVAIRPSNQTLKLIKLVRQHGHSARLKSSTA